jgi:hypothetical protein
MARKKENNYELSGPRPLNRSLSIPARAWDGQNHNMQGRAPTFIQSNTYNTQVYFNSIGYAYM